MINVVFIDGKIYHYIW